MNIGLVEGKYKCYISNNAANNIVLSTGSTGCGKSVQMQKTELDCVKRGTTGIVTDISFTHCSEYIFPPLAEEYSKYVNRINVATDGIGLQLFRGGNSEISIAALGNFYGLGLQQIAILRKAILEVEKMSPGGDDLALLNYALGMNGGEALQVKMLPLLNCGLLLQDSTRVQQGKINILELSLLDAGVLEPVSELVLAHLWSRIKRCKGNCGSIMIVLDELQNLYNKKNSTIYQILREGRKFKVNLLLATQTLSAFSSEFIDVLNQAAVRLYFRPPTNEIRRIAHEIEADKESAWQKKLANLKVGQCVAKGDLLVNGFEIRHPLILQ